MATNFVTSGLSTFPNADPVKVLRQVLLETVNPTLNYTSFKDGVKDYYTYHYAKISDINSDVSNGALLGYASTTAGGSTTLLPVSCQVKQLMLKPEFYSSEKLNETTANIFLKKGTDPEKSAPTILYDTVVALKSTAIGTFNEKYIWQADTSTTVQAQGTVMQSVDGLLAQARGGVSGAWSTYQKSSTIAATDLTALNDTSIRDHVKGFYNHMIGKNSAFSDVPTLMFASPKNFNAIYSATYGLGGQIDSLSKGVDGAPTAFKLPYAGNACTVVKTVGLDGKNNLVLTRGENICIVLDDAVETNSVDLWYNKGAKGWELDAFWKIGAKVADASDFFVTP